MDNYFKYDPPEPAVLGADRPKVAELVNFVVAAVGGRPDTEVTDKYGEQDVCRLDRLVVFDSSGHGTEYKDYIIWQQIMSRQILHQAEEHPDDRLLIGRIVRPDKAYELKTVAETLRNQVVRILEDNGWMYKTAGRQNEAVRDDGGDSF